MSYNWFILMLLLRKIRPDGVNNGNNFDETSAEEYCISEAFQPKCSDNEVIIIEEAISGRKKFGRCLKNEQDLNFDDPKVIGCYSDVRSIIDPLCSLKRSCEVRVIELNADALCYNYLKHYLEVKWSCIRVAKENRQCKVSVDGGKQNLLSPTTSNSQCGNKIQPWIIETHPGQQIKVLLIPYFNQISMKPENQVSISFKNSLSHESCQILGRIKDKYGNKETSICLAEDGSIMENIFTSNSSSLEIFMHSYEQLENKKLRYIISLEATGCSDLIPPADAWLKRTENEATIGCYSTRLRWQLKCVGQRWIGVIGNCSHGASMVLPHGHLNNESAREKLASENSMVPIVAIAMTGFVICFLIICIGVVFINRYYAISKSRALKQMANLDVPREEYNNESLAVYDSDKPFLTRNLKTIEHNGIHLNAPDGQESAQYFELDQSYMGNGHVPSKV